MPWQMASLKGTRFCEEWQPPMIMKPFSDPLAGVSGLKPGGWSRQAIGIWERTRDRSLLIQRGNPNMTAEQLKAWIRMYNLPRLPECTGEQKTAAFQWDLYHVETRGPAGGTVIVKAALAQSGKWAYIVLLAAQAEVYPELLTQVFLPALEALKPLYTGAEAARLARQRARNYADSIRSLRDNMKSGLSVETAWVSDQMKGLAMPPAQKAIDPGSELIPLPKPDPSVLKKPNILACIADRKSRRKYSMENLTLGELSYLLWATQGVRKVLPSGRHYRTVPSAGARHSFETYLVIQRVEGLKSGIYRYLPFDHQLVYLFTAENLPEKLTTLASDQPFVGNSAVCFIWSSIPYRMEWRYGTHSEQVIPIDVGHVCQNLYLAAESIGCGTCGVASYKQAALDKFLGLDGRDEFVIYLAPVGKVEQAQ
jgi:SagB-type dehydrogenase family enzyme